MIGYRHVDGRHIRARSGRLWIGAFALGVTLLGAAPVSTALAGDAVNCTCVANGQRVELGRLFCIRTASGKQFLARCERVLNNTSWKRVQDGCPTAFDWSQGVRSPLS